MIFVIIDLFGLCGEILVRGIGDYAGMGWIHPNESQVYCSVYVDFILGVSLEFVNVW